MKYWIFTVLQLFYFSCSTRKPYYCKETMWCSMFSYIQNALWLLFASAYERSGPAVICWL